MHSGLGKPILIVAAELIVAVGFEALLADAGLLDIVIRTSRHDAAIWLTQNTPSVAILDLGFKDGLCDEIAQILTNRQVPFLVCSRRGRDGLHAVYRSGDYVPKPCPPDQLVRAVRRAMAVKPMEAGLWFT